ncbi:MAG: ATP-binding protein [Candidatus Aminicenantes bacterium]|jgi:signal transduction histidine kinase/DNA-binding response OmpR family regulator
MVLNVEIRIKLNSCLKFYLYSGRLLFFLTFSLLFFWLTFAASQNKQASHQYAGFKKYIKNYSQEDIGLLGQNRYILQDKRGIIYVGNFNDISKMGSLQEFDGVSWRTIKGPKKGRISMAVDETGTIYIGGYDEIGFLTPDSTGSLQYESLVDRLAENKKKFSEAMYTHSTKEGIYFTSREYLFRWEPNSKKIKVWESKGNERFLFSSSSNGKFFVQKANIGLMQMVNHSLKLVPGGETFAGSQVTFMAPYDGKTLLIGTYPNGFYLHDGIKAVPFPTQVDDYLKEKGVNSGIRLSSGDFALATFYGGLVIIDSHGRLKEIFDKSYGLQNDLVRYVFEDSQGNLWLALEEGISKIEYTSPISMYYDLPTYIYSIIRHGNVLYVGTDNGLYSLDSDGKFRHVHGTSGRYFVLVSIDDSLLAATSKGVIQVSNKTNSKIIGEFSIALLQSKIDPKRIWVGTDQGLFSLYKENHQWKKECQFKNITQYIDSIVEDKKGNLWVGLVEKGVLKVDFPGDGTISFPVVTVHHFTQEFAHQGTAVSMAAGHVMFDTINGLFRFDEKNKVFIPDLTLGNEFAGGSKRKGFIWLEEDKNKNIWIYSFSNRRTHMAKAQPDGSYIIHSKPFLRFQHYIRQKFYQDPHEDIIWIGGKGCLMRYDTTIKKNYNLDFQTLIRRVLSNGNRVFGGYKIDIGNESKSKHSCPLIAYKYRNLHFEFAAPFFEAEAQTQYQCLLEGYENDWSEWNRRSRKDYTNLDSGRYTFRVRAKNVYGDLGSEAVFQFKVLLPWYRKWWALLSYAFVLFMLTYLVVKWRHSIKLEKEKQMLEQTVIERTKEINRKNQQLEEQSEKLKEIAMLKSRFFASISHEFRTPLTLIMGPLEQMLSDDIDNERKRKKELTMMLRNSQRLLSLINQLLELSKFESGKVKLQASRQNIIPFLKGTVASFDPVANKNELDLTFHAEEQNITLYFDVEKLEEVIFNLLSNAVKFTPAGGKITIIVQKKSKKEANFPSGWLEISICDTGPGIPKGQLAHVFQRFYQLENIYEHHQKGSGIGLAIAKEMVELHHGDIKAMSVEGEGTEFIIRLPMGDSHLKPEEIVEPSGKVFKQKSLKEIPGLYMMEKERGVPADKPEVENSNEIYTPTTEEDPGPMIPGKNIILVVEDSVDFRAYIRGCLEPLYKVVEAKNGRKGIQKAQKIIPDLIISDIMMPEVDGYALCRVLKNDINTCHIPIILLTAKASEESIIQGLETGADDYIIKPFNTKILCARIKNLIDLRRQLQEKRRKQMMLQPAEISVSSMDEEFYKELQDVIEKNLSDSEFNVEELGKKLYMSRTTLYRKVMALVGETPLQFIRSYRLKRAAQLLKANFGNVTEVAVEVGFCNMAHFTQCFKEQFHQLPSTFQDSQKES